MSATKNGAHGEHADLSLVSYQTWVLQLFGMSSLGSVSL